MRLECKSKTRLTPRGYRLICSLVDERASVGTGCPHCEWCGRTDRPLQHHHIRFRSAGGSDTIENLILLCDVCHRDLAHGVKEKEYAEAFVKYRMHKKPILDFNIKTKAEAVHIYEKYKKK